MLIKFLPLMSTQKNYPQHELEALFQLFKKEIQIILNYMYIHIVTYIEFEKQQYYGSNN